MPNNTFDISDFEKNLRDLVDRQWPATIQRALGQVGAAIIHDANAEIPQTPLKLGYLRSSASAFVNNELVFTAPWIVTEKGDQEYHPAQDHTEEIPPNTQQVTVGYNTSYAHLMHEGVWPDGREINYHYPGTGKKYLERKLQERDQLYVKLVVDALKDSENA